MKFISNQKALTSEFERLCSQYSKYKFAVAWAGYGFNMEKILWKNKSKIENAIVGLHFYQTSPDFIEKYLLEDSVRYIKQTDGTFHTKIYLFYNSVEEWEVLVGSGRSLDENLKYSVFLLHSRLLAIACTSTFVLALGLVEYIAQCEADTSVRFDFPLHGTSTIIHG